MKEFITFIVFSVVAGFVFCMLVKTILEIIG